MDIKFDKAKWQQDSDNALWLMLKVCKDNYNAVKRFVGSIKDKPYTAEIKQYREKRSLDANSYMWALLKKMAEELDTTKDELYLEALSNYGVFTHIVVKPSVVEKVKQEWRTVRELGEVIINGRKGIQLQCYFGSSTYNTKEMSVLVDGIVSECKELGIETAIPDELARMKAEWGYK